MLETLTRPDRLRLWGLALIACLGTQAPDAGTPADTPNGTPLEDAERARSVAGSSSSDWATSVPGQGWRAELIEGVVRVSGAAGGELELEVTGVGRESGVAEAGRPAQALTQGKRMTWTRPSGLLEWYESGATGLKQGFDLDVPPVGPRSEWVRIVHELRGASASLSRTRDRVFIRAEGSRQRIEYRDLIVIDTQGARLPSRLALDGSRLLIEFDDSTAAYPVRVDPVLTTAAWTVEGEVTFDRLGWTVGTAGDVNGDGYSDVLTTGAGTGQVEIYHGGAGWPGPIADWVYSGGCGGSSRPLTAGDVNGDGYSDLVVGERCHANGETDEGRVLLFYGSASGLSAAPDWTWEPDRIGALVGWDVAPAGDVNADGYDDLLVGARGWSDGVPGEGAALVFHGSSTGPAASPDWIIVGGAPVGLGTAVGPAGDVNGDGFADVLVGSGVQAGTGSGLVVLHFGSASGLSLMPDWTASGETDGDHFGESVSTAGDVNGDGYADILVGARFWNGQEGRAYMFLGGLTGPSLSPDWMVNPGAGTALVGNTVAPAGDVDGDGFADVLISGHLHDETDVDQGAAWLYRGSPAGLFTVPSWSVFGDAGAELSRGLGPAGDVNGDGYSDVIVGAPLTDGADVATGAVYLYPGSAVGLDDAANWSFDGPQGSALLGAVVGVAGDVNGDGFSDALVSAPLHDDIGVDEGIIRLFLGSAAGLPVVEDWSALGGATGDELELAAGVGDVNGDGYADVAAATESEFRLWLGSPTALSDAPDWTQPGSGGVAPAGDVNGDGFADVLLGGAVFLGSPAGLGDAPDWSSPVAASAGWTAGDVNADGFSDLLLGDRGFDGPEMDEGRAVLFLGSATGLADVPSWTFEGDVAGAQVGWAVSTAGDVNADGFSDVLVGARTWPGDFGGEGAAFLFLGSATGLSPTPDWMREGGEMDAAFGHSVAMAGDVNGDGFGDVIIGGPSFGEQHGSAMVFLGSASGLEVTAHWSRSGDDPQGRFGFHVAGGGDFNGDGFGDVLIGEYFALGQAGRAWAYFGNASLGPTRAQQQLRADASAPIDLLGLTSPDGDFLLGATATTPYGRSSVRLEWEVEPIGPDPFGAPARGSSPWTDIGAPGPTGLSARLDGAPAPLASAGAHRVRTRVRSAFPYPWASQWLSLPGNNLTETDLRRLGSFAGELSITKTLSETAGPPWTPITVTLTVTNESATDQTNVVVEDSVPSCFIRIDDMSIQGTVAGTPLFLDPLVRYTMPLLMAGETAVITFDMAASSPPPPECCNVASARSDQAASVESAPACFDMSCLEPSALDLDPSVDPLRVSHPNAAELLLTWQAIGGATNELYEGTLDSLWTANLYDHGGTGNCDLPAATVTIPLPSVDSYFLAAASCGGAPSLLGRDSAGLTRAPAAPACP